MKRYVKYFLVVLSLFVFANISAQTTKWRDMHRVKKRETIFGIAKDYNISIQDLLNANPEMKVPGYELKKGDWIFVPFAKSNDRKSVSDVNRQAANNNPAAAKKVAANAIKVGVMLPLHNQDGDGLRMIEFYRGVLLALDELKTEGITTDVHAWNVPKDADIRATLSDKNAASLNIIFGPLYSNQVKPLADFCHNNNIKLVIPFSIEGNEVASNTEIYQVYQNDDLLNNKAIAAFLERFQKSHHPIFIDCNDPNSQVGAFTSGLRKQLELANVKYDLTNINSSATDFAKHFSTVQPNVIILNSEKSPQLNTLFAKLDALKRSKPGVAIAMFGYNQWFMYQNYNLAQFFKYNVYIPSTYYYNSASDKTQTFENLYKNKYNTTMSSKYIPRFAINGYDQTQFFIRGYKQYGTKFRATSSEVKYKPLQNRFNFERIGQGGYRNKFFQLIHFKVDQTLESLVY